MYTGRTEPVDVPKVGHIHKLKNGYVYFENGGRWDNQRKVTVDSRVSIGKLVPGCSDRMYPNKNYELLFPDGKLDPERAAGLSAGFSKEARGGRGVRATEGRSLEEEKKGGLSEKAFLWRASWPDEGC